MGHESTAFDIHIWGARGTLPGSGGGQVEYGTETCCVEMRVGGRRLIFDAGTGIVPLGRAMIAEGLGCADLFFSHVHYDHIMGLPFFLPLYRSSFEISISAGHMQDGRTSAEIVADYMRAPFLPITPELFTATVHYRTFEPGDALELAPDIRIRTARLWHPNGAVGYRVEHAGRVVSYITDTEHEPGVLDEAVLSLFQDADVVFYDSTYADCEMVRFRGFGHSSWEHGIRLCKAANARRLVLFHHAHTRDDHDIARIEAEARALFPGSVAGRTGLHLRLPAATDTIEPFDVRQD